MFNWLTKNTISSVKAIRTRFSTNIDKSKVPTKILPEIEDFQYILDDRILHIDKSLLISDLIDRKTVLITRPRRWGKSLNLKMLESFFQPKFSSKGNIINDDGKKEKFSRMLIGSKILSEHPFTGKNEETKIIDLQGSLPVITLTLNDVTNMSEYGIKVSFIKAIRKAMINHEYLYTSKKVKSKLFKSILREYVDNGGYNLATKEIDDHLLLLVESLYTHHHRKVIILVDEYDKPLVSVKLDSPELYKFACTQYKNVFSLIKNDTDLIQLSVFTGVTRIVNEEIFSGINNFYRDSVVTSRISKCVEHFGFTQTDVYKLIKQAKQYSKLELDEDKIKEELSQFYNGYRIDDTLIYNPYSVMNCLHNLTYNKKPAYQNYWVKKGNPALIIEALQEHRKLIENIESKKIGENKEDEANKETKIEKEENLIEKLIKTGYVEFTPADGTDLGNIRTNQVSLLTLMLDAGYITQADEEGVYRIPNTEVRHQFFDTLNKAWFSEKEQSLFRVTIEQNEFEDPEIFIKTFQQKVLRYFKREKYPEFFFQTILYGCVNAKFGALEYKTKDSKKIDIVLRHPKDKTTAYIIEIKKQDSNSKDYSINKALYQILEKKYAESIMNENKEFTTFVIRVVYFEINRFSDWDISMVELKFERDNLKRAIECFVSDADSVQKSQENERIEVERKEVLNNDNLFEELKKFALSYFPR